nr:hypothetical protein [uncultured Flavobacterium sp.]
MFIRKFSIVLLAMMGITVYAQTGKQVTLSHGYRPETTYKQTLAQQHSTTIQYKANEDVLNVLKEQGVQNPTVQNINSGYTTEVKTGKSLDGKTFPLTIKFLKVPQGFEKGGLTTSTKIYGHGEIGTFPKIDSIASPEMSDKLKTTLLATIDGLLSQTKFPEKAFKKGETQQVISPVTVPIAGTTIDMDLITDYTLTEIKNNIAKFNIAITYKTKTADPKYRITGLGSGKGVMDYDIKKKFPVSQKSDIIMQMAFTYKEFDMEINSNMHYDISCQIVPDAK